MKSDKDLLRVIAEKIITSEDVSRIDLGVNIGTMRWTGWKEVTWAIEKHAQIVLYDVGGTRDAFYVDIPSMRHGKFLPGQAYDISYQEGVSKSMYPGSTTIEMAREWIKEAILILIDDVLKYRPEILDRPYANKEHGKENE